LQDKKWLANRGIDELAAEASGFWIRQLLHASSQEQRDYCFRKMIDTEREIAKIKQAKADELTPEKAKTADPAAAPNNVYPIRD
jgi:hypothetical protein